MAAARNDLLRAECRALMAYLRHVEPIDTVGYSILLFQLSPQDLNRALNEPLVNSDRR